MLSLYHHQTSLIGTLIPIERRPPGRPLFYLLERALKTKTPFEDKLLAIVAPIAADLGFEVVRIRVMGGTRRKRLQVMAERPDGSMTVDGCAALSRALSAVLDVEDPFEGEWDLEVSSPGVDRPLTELQHFARWEGFDAKLELDRMVEGRKRFSGTLAGVEDDNVLIDLKGEEATAEIPFAWIADAKLTMSDALLAESLKRSGRDDTDGDEDGHDDIGGDLDAAMNEDEETEKEG